MAESPGTTYTRPQVIRAAAISVIAGVVLTILAFALGGGFNSGTQTVAGPTRVVSATGSADVTLKPWHGLDFYPTYRHKPSYLGPLAMVNLKPGRTYYLPNEVQLDHTGNGMWFIHELSVPVLANAKDAGHNPLKLRAILGPPRYESAHGYQGSYLQITLPDRYAYGWDGSSPPYKNISAPANDIRDSAFNHVAMIPVAVVQPAPGHTLAGYYDDNSPALSQLPVGSTGWVYIGFAKQVAGTTRGFVENYGYEPGTIHPVHNGFIRVTHTAGGFVACAKVPQALIWHVQQVPAAFTPQATDVAVSFHC